MKPGEKKEWGGSLILRRDWFYSAEIDQGPASAGLGVAEELAKASLVMGPLQRETIYDMDVVVPEGTYRLTLERVK